MKVSAFHSPARLRPADCLKKLLGVKGRPIGSGAFANVYKSPSGNKVVKIGDLGDPYLTFIRAAAKTRLKTKMLPRATKLLLCFESGSDPDEFEGEGSYAVVLERLRHAKNHQERELLDLACAAFDTEGWGSDISFADVIKLMAKTKIKVQSLLEMARVAEWISELCDHHGHDLDLHDGNIMFRGRQLVITDPFC